jgi:hypothetical protein
MENHAERTTFPLCSTTALEAPTQCASPSSLPRFCSQTVSVCFTTTVCFILFTNCCTLFHPAVRAHPRLLIISGAIQYEGPHQRRQDRLLGGNAVFATRTSQNCHNGEIDLNMA